MNQVDAFKSPASYFAAVYQTFQFAEQTTAGSSSHYFKIDGQIIKLRFAGSALISKITSALEHLRWTSTKSPQLTILIWDSESTQYPFPLHPWTVNESSPFQKGFRMDEERIHYHDPQFRMYFYISEMIYLMNYDRSLAIFWISDARKLPYYEAGMPLRTVFDWWFRSTERQLVHAASLGTEDGGVLLIGKGGSGKSTTTLACLDSPLQMAGDDYCLIGNKPSPYVHSLYSSAKLDSDNIDKFPHLRSHISNLNKLETEKALLFLHFYQPQKIIKRFPLRATLIPRVTGGDKTSIRPASSAASLIALAPSTIFQLVEPSKRSFEFLVQVVRSIPSYYLDLGTDLSQIPSEILALLSKNKSPTRGFNIH